MNTLKLFRKSYWSISMLALFLIISCTGNEAINPISIQKQIKTRTINDSKLSEQLNFSFKSKSSQKSSMNHSFNFNQVSEVENTETGEVAYMIDSNDYDNIKLGAYIVEHGGYEFLIAEYKTDNPTKEIIYKDLNGEIVLKVFADTTTEEITVERPLKENIIRSSGDPGCGQKVADCLADNYTNKGWASVGLWVVTGFYPAFGIGAAIGCAAAVC